MKLDINLNTYRRLACSQASHKTVYNLIFSWVDIMTQNQAPFGALG